MWHSLTGSGQYHLNRKKKSGKLQEQPVKTNCPCKKGQSILDWENCFILLKMSVLIFLLNCIMLLITWFLHVLLRQFNYHARQGSKLVFDFKIAAWTFQYSDSSYNWLQPQLLFSSRQPINNDRCLIPSFPTAQYQAVKCSCDLVCSLCHNISNTEVATGKVSCHDTVKMQIRVAVHPSFC